MVVCDRLSVIRSMTGGSFWSFYVSMLLRSGDLARDVLAGENLRTVGVRQNRLSRHEPQD